MRHALLAAALLSTGASANAGDPLLKPIAPESSRRWLVPRAPVHVFGNSYVVGFAGLDVALIHSGKGLILIDGAVPQAVPDIRANIAKLGFDIRDVKLILSTEPHFDHAGGIAALARDSGARVVSGMAAVEELRSGRPSSTDPQAGTLPAFPGAPRVSGLRDGENIRLGDTIITARATPGHTPGSTSWSWRTCEGKDCADILFASSLNAVGATGFRFTDHPALVASFRDSIRRMRTLPCDILLTPHPDQSGGDGKRLKRLAGTEPNPFRAPGACRAYADQAEKRLNDRLAKEQAAK